MLTRKFVAILGSASLACSAAAQSVSVSLTSPQNGQSVAAGATINWSISFTVSAGNNQGLALLVTDLTQDASNPAFLDIAPATNVPAPMSNFSRPAGISNPGEGGPTGYVGVQRGTAGQRDLVQIGGAQNTFGTARPPGSGVAENANVVGGVGQSGSVTLASGSFSAPSTNGTYVFRLSDAVANVIQTLNSPPNFSPVVQASVTLAAPSISFSVGGAPCLGDLDNNGTIDIADLAILLSQFGSSGPGFSGDINNDNTVNIADLALLLSVFGSPC
jgi:hypothetical protein